MHQYDLIAYYCKTFKESTDLLQANIGNILTFMLIGPVSLLTETILNDTTSD